MSLPVDSIQLNLDRLLAGDEGARVELIRVACDRLTNLTRQMLRDFPGVRRWEDTDDVFQNAVMRLCGALKQITPRTANEFFRLAALQIRRELLDLARHYYGPQGHGAHHASDVGEPGSVSRTTHPGPLPLDSTYEPSRLAVWSEFHQRVDALPETEREVFDLLWYQGLTQSEAATVLGIHERTVLRRWQQARLQVHRALRGQLPGL